ncbi:MAG: hypothetical protein ACRD6W_06695 [Nitrososphaerales archaeon]
MEQPIAAEPGSELFRGPDGDTLGFDLAFGPVAGGQPRWSLLRTRTGAVVGRLSLDDPRPPRRQLRIWLTQVVGEHRALELLARVGRFQHFYRDYYAARPDLVRRHLVAVA